MLKRAVLSALVALALASCQPAAAPIHHWSEAPPEVQAVHSPEVIQSFIDAYWRNVWIETYWERVVAFTEAVERARVVHGGTPPYVDGILVCNGTDLPTCGIVKRESGFNPRARNPRSSAGGLYQFIYGTFRSICPEAARAYGNAANAPVSVQVACARILWSHGRGRGHWAQTL